MEKPGYKTTEFVLATAAFLIGVVLMVAGEDSSGRFLVGMAIGPYAASRGLVKFGQARQERPGRPSQFGS